MTSPIDIALESTPRKTFATAVDWPGLSRSGKTTELALEALRDHLPRYAAVLDRVGSPHAEALAPFLRSFRLSEITPNIIENGSGNSGTEFGVPSLVTDADRRPASAAEAGRLAAIVAAAWEAIDAAAAQAPPELRKGPRGGGRDRDKIVAHVIEADHAYAREIGVRLKAPTPSDRPAVEAMRDEMLAVLREPSDGSPLADRRWTTRYAAHRIAWHALDHAWEIEDRTEPG